VIGDYYPIGGGLRQDLFFGHGPSIDCFGPFWPSFGGGFGLLWVPNLKRGVLEERRPFGRKTSLKFLGFLSLIFPI